jgi:hypothetical protein
MPALVTGQNAAVDGVRAIATHVGALTALTSTEASGGGYARQAVSFPAAASGTSSNSGAVAIPIGAGSADIVALGLYTALSGGSLVGYYPLGSTGQVLQGVGAVEAIGTDVIRSNGHGLAADNRVFFAAVNNEALPTGLSASTLYFVRATGLTSDTFTVATSSGGAAVDITALGEVAWFKTVPQPFPSAGNINIAAGQLVLDGRFV